MTKDKQFCIYLGNTDLYGAYGFAWPDRNYEAQGWHAGLWYFVPEDPNLYPPGEYGGGYCVDILEV